MAKILPSVRIADGALYLDAFTTTDRVVIDYIRQIETEKQADGLAQCLQVGARALTYASDRSGAAHLAEAMKASADSTKTLLTSLSKEAHESIRRSTETFPKSINVELSKLQKELEGRLDPDKATSVIGRLRNAMMTDFRNVSEKLAQDLSLVNPESPLSQIRKEFEDRHTRIEKQLGEILQQQAARVAAASQRSKSAAKGIDLENALETFLADTSRPRRDLLTRVGTETGFDGNKRGDFLITVDPSAAGGPGLRIVLEAKNDHAGTAAIVRELDQAIHNRGASFAIAITTNAQAVPGSSILSCVGEDKILVYAPPLPDDAGYDFLGVEAALEIGRCKAIVRRAASNQDIDLRTLDSEVTAAISSLERFADLKRKISAIKTSAETAHGCATDVEREILSALQKLKAAVERELAAIQPAA